MTAAQTYRVRGMTCEHCVRALSEELRGLSSVTDVAVELVPQGDSAVTVSSTAALDPAAVRAAVAEAGYELVD